MGLLPEIPYRGVFNSIHLFSVERKHHTMASISKMVNNRKVTGERVILAINCHGPECIPEAERKLNQNSNGSEPIVLQPLFTALEQVLTKACDTLVRSDLDVAQEAADDPGIRQVRDTTLGDSVENTTGIKKLISGAYGDEILADYGLSGVIPSNPDQMVTYGKNIVELLRSKPFTRSLRPGAAPLDTSIVADVIEASTNKLEKALSNVKTEEKELELVIRDRTRAITEWQETYVFVATIVAAVFRYAGRADLAEKVRPTTRKESGAEEGEVVEEVLQAQTTGA
jgi:hypothetical protein